MTEQLLADLESSVPTSLGDQCNGATNSDQVWCYVALLRLYTHMYIYLSLIINGMHAHTVNNHFVHHMHRCTSMNQIIVRYNLMKQASPHPLQDGRDKHSLLM